MTVALSLSRRLAMACMVASAASWGLATVATKDVLNVLPPFTLLAIQLTASVTFLWLIVLVTRTACTGLTWTAASTGALEPGLAYAVGVPGLAMTGAASASVIAATEPMMIALIAWGVLRQPLAPRAALGVAAGVAGVMILTGGAGGQSHIFGDALIFLGVCFAAVYVLASARLVGSVAPLPLAASQQTVGLGLAVVALCVAVLMGWETVPAHFPLPVLLAAAASGIVQYALAFWFYLTGLRALPVTTAAPFLTLTPLFGVAGAIVVLGESLTLLQTCGGIIVIAALLITVRD
jgi:drug/metabolite transporter (DMT)-like permease